MTSEQRAEITKQKCELTVNHEITLTQRIKICGQSRVFSIQDNAHKRHVVKNTYRNDSSLVCPMTVVWSTHDNK